MADAIRLSNVIAGYQDTIVLEDISFAIGNREAWAVLGRNGVGKTTLLATLMGLTWHRAGTIQLGDKEITNLPSYVRARMGLGYVPQEREIFPSLTVAENLMVAARPGEWTRERIYELFPRLAERRTNYGNQLSGGELQMLAVGRALASNPTILLLDEPFEGLAPVIVDTLVDVLMRLRTESHMTVILVEQQVEIALSLTDIAVVLDKGQVAWHGSSVELGKSGRLDDLIGLKEMT